MAPACFFPDIKSRSEYINLHSLHGIGEPIVKWKSIIGNYFQSFWYCIPNVFDVVDTTWRVGDNRSRGSITWSLGDSKVREMNI